jgi:hypothetical protein
MTQETVHTRRPEEKMTAEPGKPPSTASAQPHRCEDDWCLAPSSTHDKSLPKDVGDNFLAPPARSVYRGISYDPASNMWRSRMYCSRKHVTLGRFSSAQEAAFVHDRAAYYIHGDAAKTNFGLDTARESNKRKNPSGAWRIMATLDALTKEVKLIRVQEERSDGGGGCGNAGGNGGNGGRSLLAKPPVPWQTTGRIDTTSSSSSSGGLVGCAPLQTTASTTTQSSNNCNSRINNPLAKIPK